MFAWLFGKKKEKPSKQDEVYRPTERLIYQYWNGIGDVKADPMILYKKWRSIWPELSAELKVATSEMLKDKDTIPAHNRAVEMIRGIFDLKPYPLGLTEAECDDLLNHFLDYCDRLKKDSAPSPTSSTPTGASPTSSTEGPITNSSSGSGSIGGEPTSASPVPSPTDMESPSVT